MSEGLKALERLIDNKVFISLGRTQGKKQFANDINIIKTELKERDKIIDLSLKECRKIAKLKVEHYKKDKALEIIKEIAKSYEIEFNDKKLSMSFKIRMNNKFVLETISFKNQEEYDLLKEVLL